ncbi:MAG: nuclear transport factor 2 family protein [Bacteroidetes bacterium]|nr:nuclear transport factor 2 family protein [Bacteroidota bacterium]
MKFLPLLLALFLIAFSSLGQTTQEQLVELDQGWERALLNSEVEFLENLLAEEFVWVHNHASLIDGKTAVLNRAKKIRGGQPDDTRNRSPRDQQVVLLGQTAVVSGFTVVDRGPKPTTYHFMRTYVLVDGSWKLLANHTMAIPEE